MMFTRMLPILQMAAKRDLQQDKEAQEWVETVLGAKFPPGQDYEDVLRDGTVLCQLINKLAPGSVPKINTSGGQFKFMENINKYVESGQTGPITINFSTPLHCKCVRLLARLNVHPGVVRF